MKLGDFVEVVSDGNIGLSLVGARGKIVGTGENGYDWSVSFVDVGFTWSMWFNTDELKEVVG